MPPFIPPNVVLSGFKERIESLLVQGDKLYVGTGVGNVHVYTISDPSGSGEQQVELVDIKKALSRRAIEQLSYVQDINSLVVLSESLVTLYPLPNFTPPTPLLKTKSAWSFAVYSGVEYEDTRNSVSSMDGSSAKPKGVPVMVTYLVVGCKRKVVWYSWRDGEAQEVQEAALPHSPRTVTFLNNDTVCFGYTPTDYVLFSLKARTTTEITTPVPTTTSTGSMGMGMGAAFTGLSGYMTLGLGAKQKPNVVKANDKELLIAKDNNGVFVGEDAKLTRSISIDWPAPPEEMAMIRPYIFSIFPPGTVPMSQIETDPSNTTPLHTLSQSQSQSHTSVPSFIPTSVVEVRSSISLTPVQTLPIPFLPPPAGAPPTYSNQTVRLLTASPGSKSPLFLVTTPLDRATATAEGSTIWECRIKTWGDQVDELVASELYANALSLLETIEQALLPDKEKRQKLVKALNAVSQFRSGQFADAITTFMDLNMNPAKVIALYPESVAGRLSVPQDDWIPLFGGPKKERPAPSESKESVDSEHDDGASTSTQGQGPNHSPPRPPSPQGSVRGMLKSGLDTIIASARKEDDASSIRSKRKEPPPKPDDFKRSIEELLRYLSELRRKITGALDAFHITNAQSQEMPLLSTASTSDLYDLPDAPLGSLTPEQLVRFGQIVDTALFKSYLIVRPGLLGSLCRVGNWCEVSEVEEVLRAREKFSELIFLYSGKKMHGKALELLRQLSEKETDMRDKLMPSVQYLQRLGPEHLDQIFEYAHWVFEQDRDIAFEIFTSDEAELPHQPVADYLEMIDPSICARYVEFLITDRGEESPAFHDRLAELYLRMTVAAKKSGDGELRKKMYTRLLSFIDTTRYYRPDRLFGLLPSDDLYEAKAILLGRLGRHDNALEIYVYRLQDFAKAEDYCKRVYTSDGPTSSVFLTLLRIYLRPTSSSVSSITSPTSSSFKSTSPIASPPTPSVASLLKPALDLISRHSPRLDKVETLKLLPPLVSAKDVEAFLIEALRGERVFDGQVVRNISKARDEEIDRKLMVLKGRRVRVGESRICPQCHKRLGYSVIAVHAPRGEVTHYQCREAFSKKLKELRGMS
ncbi:Vam6/VPS39/TRAP1 family protein [Abortiporus biennis]